MLEFPDLGILQKPEYEYPGWEKHCSGICGSVCLTTSQFLAVNLEYNTVIETITVTALTDDTMSFQVLLSNTTRFLPSPITWKSCIHGKGELSAGTEVLPNKH